MRIYKINIEHAKVGLNWSAYKVAAPSFEKALQHARKQLQSFERIESIELLESTD